MSKHCRLFFIGIVFLTATLQAQDKVTAGSVEYWFDNEYDKIVTSKIEGTTSLLDIGIEGLDHGIHHLYYRIKDSEGNYSPVNIWMFYRDTKQPVQQISKENPKTLEYWFDNEYDKIVTSKIEGTTSLLDIGIEGLDHGIHHLYYRIKDSEGNYSPVNIWMFYRDTKSGNGIKGEKISWYKYWWNDYYDKGEHIIVEEPASPIVFSQKLVVPEYARNDGYLRKSEARFNIVFGDDKGNISIVEHIDVPYPDLLPPISLIEGEQTNTHIALKWSADEDEIKFYNIYVSENEEPFILWLPNTENTSATYSIKEGCRYRFTITACDKAGNMEKYDENKNIEIPYSPQ